MPQGRRHRAKQRSRVIVPEDTPCGIRIAGEQGRVHPPPLQFPRETPMKSNRGIPIQIQSIQLMKPQILEIFFQPNTPLQIIDPSSIIYSIGSRLSPSSFGPFARQSLQNPFTTPVVFTPPPLASPSLFMYVLL